MVGTGSFKYFLGDSHLQPKLRTAGLVFLFFQTCSRDKKGYALKSICLKIETNHHISFSRKVDLNLTFIYKVNIVESYQRIHKH